jgi:hypothetical protein
MDFLFLNKVRIKMTKMTFKKIDKVLSRYLKLSYK